MYISPYLILTALKLEKDPEQTLVDLLKQRYNMEGSINLYNGFDVIVDKVIDDIKGAKVVGEELVLIYIHLLHLKLITPYAIGTSAYNAMSHQARALVRAGLLLTNASVDNYKAHNLTDVKRLYSFLSSGHLELTKDVKFIRLDTNVRNLLVADIKRLINEDELARGQEVWKHIMHGLNICKSQMTKKGWGLLKRLHHRKYKLRSFESYTDMFIAKGDNNKLVDHLASRPNELLKRLMYICEVNDTKLISKAVETLSVNKHKLSVERLINTAKAATKGGEKGITQNGVTYDIRDTVYNPVEVLMGLAKDTLRQRVSDTLGNKRIVITSQHGEVLRCGVPVTKNRDVTDSVLPPDTTINLGKASDLDLVVSVHWDEYIDIDLSGYLVSDSFNGVFNWQAFRNHSSDTLNHSGDDTEGGPGAHEWLKVSKGELKYPGHFMVCDVRNYTNTRPLKDVGVKMKFSSANINSFGGKCSFTADLQSDSTACAPFMLQHDIMGSVLLHYANIVMPNGSITTRDAGQLYITHGTAHAIFDVCDMLNSIATDDADVLELDINSSALRNLFK